MNSPHRTGRILVFLGLGMVVFSLFMLLDRAPPLVLDSSALTDEAMELIGEVQSYFGQYVAKMYIANVIAILGGIVMVVSGLHLSRKEVPLPDTEA